MALANVAWMLASNGKRVLAVDWDLEAPGLPRYFRPFVSKNIVASTPGLVELFNNYIDACTRRAGALPSILSQPERDVQVDVANHLVPLQWHFEGGGSLDLLSAGRPGPHYSEQVRRIDWEAFYAKFSGAEFIDALRRRLCLAYDYVLVDSRTGVSDTASICTVQLPDILVVCFSLNHQSIEGSALVASSVDDQRNKRADARTLRIFPIPMRVELSERKKLDAARSIIASTFSPFLGHLGEGAASRYWGSVEIPAIPFYGYEEILCAFGDAPGSVISMTASIQRITAYLSDGEVTAVPNVEEQARSRMLAAFEAPPEKEDSGPSCFISYSTRDSAFVEKLHADLENAGVNCWFAPHDLPIGTKIRVGLDRAINQNDQVILILSANSVLSAWVEKEVETAFERERAIGRTVLLPLSLDETVRGIQEGWPADIRRQRNIGDFRAWQDEEAYAHSFRRLLASLRAQADEDHFDATR
jgi:hypothetical protein